jgi:hypothetical protein
MFNPLVLVFGKARLIPIHFTGIEDRIPALADIDECGFHRRKDVLYFAKVDVSDIGDVAVLVDVMLDQDLVLEDCDLGTVTLLSDDHLSLY